MIPSKSKDSSRRPHGVAVRNPFGRKGLRSKRILTWREEARFRQRFAVRIRRMREDIGLKQCDLVARLGVSQGRIKAYETGQSIPRTHELAPLCRVLHTDPNTLLDFSA